MSACSSFRSLLERRYMDVSTGSTPGTDSSMRMGVRTQNSYKRNFRPKSLVFTALETFIRCLRNEPSQQRIQTWHCGSSWRI